MKRLIDNMLNIQTITYQIKFLDDLTFREEPEIAFYKTIFNRLKNILCINIKEECISCSYNKKCLYSYLTAADFLYIENLPVKVHRPLFSKRLMKAGDILDLKFTILGDAIKHVDFIDFILREFEARGLYRENYRFMVINRTIGQLYITRGDGEITGLKIITPIDVKENIFIREKEKLDILNRLYNMTDNPIDKIDISYLFDGVKFKVHNPLRIGRNRIIQEGYIGQIKFNKPIKETHMLDIISIIGAGRYYAIGGGAIEVYRA